MLDITEPDLAGLPAFVRAAAKAAARRARPAGKTATVCRDPPIEPFLQFSTRRDLREKAL